MSLRYSIYKVQLSVLGDFCFARTSIFYHSSFRLSSTFLSFFKNFFSSFPNDFLVVIAALQVVSGRSSDIFYILADLQEFVKNFFQVLTNFFSIRFASTALADSLHIITSNTSFVNTFFQLFPQKFAYQKGASEEAPRYPILYIIPHHR